jgi:hypothetical protein
MLRAYDGLGATKERMEVVEQRCDGGASVVETTVR